MCAGRNLVTSGTNEALNTWSYLFINIAASEVRKWWPTVLNTYSDAKGTTKDVVLIVPKSSFTVAISARNVFNALGGRGTFTISFCVDIQPFFTASIRNFPNLIADSSSGALALFRT